MKRNILFILFIFTMNLVFSQDLIKIEGNGIEIVDGSVVTSIADGTDFESIVVGASSQSHSFEITSLSTNGQKVQVQSITIDQATEFSNTVINGSFAHGETRSFTITYNPTIIGEQTAIVSIVAKKPSGSPRTYTFSIKGNAIGRIMMAQYYDNGVNEFIEVKNISSTDIDLTTDKLYFGIYNSGTSTANAPDGVVDLMDYDSDNVFSVDEVILIEENTADFFKGNNILVISSSSNTSCYANRIDIIGEYTFWGLNKSFTKGSCASEITHLTFDINDWVELTTTEVDDADVAGLFQNISKGYYNLGPTEANNGVWSNGETDRTRDLIVVSDYPIAADPIGAYSNNVYEACSITIQAGNTFVFEDDLSSKGSIVIYKDLTVETGAEFVLGDKKSLVMWDDNATITVDGTFTKNEKTSTLQSFEDVTYWSSPVESAQIATVFADVSSSKVYEMNPTQINSKYTDEFQHWFIVSGTMEKAKGYAALGDENITYPGEMSIDFLGTPNNGDISIGISQSINTDGLDLDYNLIGNPYPSAIDAVAFINGNVGKFNGGTVYFWTHETSITDDGDYAINDYVQYNLSGGTPNTVTNNIGSGQGFMVEALSTTTLAFNNAMRLVDENDQFYKSSNKKGNLDEEEKDRVWLKLNYENISEKELLLGFFDEATDGVDFGYDGKLNSVNEIKFYSVLEDNKYAIQGLGVFSSDKKIDIGFDTNETGEFVIGIAKKEGVFDSQEIYLVDNDLNIITDLSKGDYVFNQEEVGVFKSRFALQFEQAALGVEDIENVADYVVVSESESLKVNANKKVISVKVFDMLGRNLINLSPFNTNFEIPTSHIKKGTILVIQAGLENGVTVNKKVIKR